LYAQAVSDDRTLRAPEAPRAQQQHELIAFVAEAAGRLHFAEQQAQSLDVDQAIARDLRQLAARLEALHLVVMVECGWCPRCGAPLTDPERSPSRTRHCQRCSVGWQLARQDGRITAEALPWPHSPNQASGR
jgi:hypothetical protein